MSWQGMRAAANGSSIRDFNAHKTLVCTEVLPRFAGAVEEDDMRKGHLTRGE